MKRNISGHHRRCCFLFLLLLLACSPAANRSGIGQVSTIYEDVCYAEGGSWAAHLEGLKKKPEVLSY